MTDDLTPEILEQHRERIAAFAYRARRVEAHSLLRDPVQFKRWAAGTSTFTTVDAQTTLTWELPPEEAFESLASRCRPFTLQGDPVQVERVIGSLRAFVKRHSVYGPQLESLRESWKRALDPSEGTGFSALHLDSDQGTSWVTLADAWIYGDLVHADPQKQVLADGHALDTRYIAAVMRYGAVAIHAVGTLNYIRACVADGLLDLPSEVTDSAVVASTPMELQVSGMVEAPAGTSLSEMRAALDSQEQ